LNTLKPFVFIAKFLKKLIKLQTLRMTALLEGLKYNWLVCRKHEKIEKVTGSQDDDFVGELAIHLVGYAACTKDLKGHRLSG
jgi:hypothetical protein